MNPTFARNAIYLPVQRALGGNLDEAIRFHKSMERKPQETLKKNQEKSLAALLRHAFENIPFYRDLPRRHVDLTATTPFDILTTLPILTKADLRAKFPLFTDNRYRPSWRSTSGSTGFPFQFCKDRPSLLQMDAAMHAVYSWHGIEVGDRQARIWGRALESRQKLVQDIKDILLNRRRLSAFTMTREQAKQFFVLLANFRPAFLYCYPNAAAFFAQHVRDMGLNAATLGLQAIICTSEPLLESLRRILTETFACPTVAEYGTSENGILAMECERGNMHILSGNVILEFLKGNDPVAHGELGEVVVTELHSRSIPFIRYRTGDLGSPLAGQCACGRTYPLLSLACGRDHSFIVCPDGHRVHVALLVYILKQGVLQFRVIQETPNELIVELVPDRDYTRQVEEIFRAKFHEYCGDAMHIIFNKRDRIPPERNGKTLYFVSRLDEARS
jgi:phenylacetate-CoA ligase